MADTTIQAEAEAAGLIHRSLVAIKLISGMTHHKPSRQALLDINNLADYTSDVFDCLGDRRPCAGLADRVHHLRSVLARVEANGAAGLHFESEADK